jgi:alpha-tubulin suppressor-like RCC1 family protein
VEGINTARWVACGSNFTVVITMEGNVVVAFGRNTHGELGVNLGRYRLWEGVFTPQLVENIPFPVVSVVAAGAHHSVYLGANGRVATVGWRGQYLEGVAGGLDIQEIVTPVELPGDQPPLIMAVAAGYDKSLLLTVDHQILILENNRNVRNLDTRIEYATGMSISPTPQTRLIVLHGGTGCVSIFGSWYDLPNNFAEAAGGGRRELNFIPGVDQAVAVACGLSHFVVMERNRIVKVYGILKLGNADQNFPRVAIPRNSPYVIDIARCRRRVGDMDV